MPAVAGGPAQAIDVSVLAGSVQLARDGKAIRVHPIRHDRFCEFGVFVSPKDPGGLFATGRARFSIWAVLIGHDPSCGRSFPSSRPQNGCVMSMQPAAWPEPHPQIAAAVKAMYGSRKT